jgi:hypothetical protein
VQGAAEVWSARSGERSQAIGRVRTGELVGEFRAFQHAGFHTLDVVSVAADTRCLRFHVRGPHGAGFRARHPQLWFALLRMFARSCVHTLRLAHHLRCALNPHRVSVPSSLQGWRGFQQSVATPQAARGRGSPTLQTLQGPILQRPWAAFEVAAFQTVRFSSV